MEKILKFLRYDPQKQVFLLLAFASQLVVRVALGALPFYVVLNILKRIRSVAAHLWHDRTTAYRSSTDGRQVPQLLAWAIHATSPFVPGSRCLCQAIAGQILMSVNGVQTELRIGVQKNDASMIAAHAWLVRQETILLGNLPNMAEYIPFPMLSGVIG